MSGNDGADHIYGGHGADMLWGGPGADTLEGGPDNDRIVTYDDRDNSDIPDLIDCGPGLDRAEVDPSDQPADDCEHVTVQ